MSETPEIDRPRAGGLALAAGTAFAHGLWALFQWTQLVAARTGGSSFCGIGDADSASCTAIWDSPFASAIQGWTGVPVAGWGLIWSVAAFVLPLWTLVQLASRTDDPENRATGSAWAATVWLALGGLGAIAVLLTASLLQGNLCTTCVVTYTIVAIYAAICLVQMPLRSVPLGRGISLASGALGLSFVLLFIPGLRTPLSESEAGKQVLEEVARARQAEPEAQAPDAPTPSERTAGGPSQRTAGGPSQSAAGPPSGPHGAPPLNDGLESLGKMLEQLPPQLEQAFSDELDRYANAPHVPMREPRALVGAADAAVRLTEFTDVLCGHCASLHETITQLAQSVPPGAFALEARHFPLDSACNSELEGESTAPVRCVAAKAVICVEQRGSAFEYAGRIYQNQKGLTEDQVYELAEPLVPRAELAACVNDAATAAKLSEDVAWAKQHDIHGTPLVLLNGKQVAAFGPLLYALILTGGDSAHPVFANLPAPQPPKPHTHAH